MKKINRILISIVIIFLLLYCKCSNVSQAGEMSTYAHKSYSSIMNISASSLAGTYFSYDNNDESLRQDCNRFICLHKEAATSTVNFRVYAVIDIDGANPTTAIYTTSSGSRPVTNSWIAALAYISAKAEINHADNGSYAYSKAFAYLVKYHLNEVLDSGLPSSTDAAANGIYEDAKEYAESVGSASETYSARIIVFIGGAAQETAMLYGKAGTNGNISVNKYISSSGSRSGYSESQKSSNPVNVDPLCGETVTYTIEVKNTYSEAKQVTLTDVFEIGSYGGLKIENYDGWTKLSARRYQRTITVPAKSSKTVTLKVKVYSNFNSEELTSISYDETYKNTVTITGSGLNISKNTSSDYVRAKLNATPTPGVEPAGTIEKYVSAVNGVAVSGRSNRSSTDKYKDPVVVQKGDIVTYTIKVKNTASDDGMSDGQIYNCKMVDTAESGLTITERNGLTNFSINRGGTYTATVKVKVTKSNMYLYDLENDIDFTYGEYTKYVEVEYTCGAEDCEGHTRIDTYPNTPLSSSSIDSINSGNKDKDYVRLKELTIAGNVYVDKDKDGYKNNSDSYLSGIKVILHNVTNGTTMTTTTDSNGHYEFSGFYKGTNFTKPSGKSGYYPTTARHKQYYVEYQYDGVKYISTVYSGRNNLSSDNSYNMNYLVDSNACEYTAERTAFNQSLETIAYNKGIDRSHSNTQKVLEFTKSGHTSTWNWTPSTTMSSYSFVKSASSGTKDNLFLSTDGETDYLEHINLGLQEREKLDLRVTKDLMEAQVRINGYSMNYDYGQIDQSSALYEKSDAYELYIYKTDYNYRYEMYKNQDVRTAKGESSELQVDLTYKITVHNDSADATYARINEVVDFYTDKMSVKDGTVYMMKNGTRTDLTITDSSTYNSEQNYSFSGYRTKFIKGMDSVVLSKGEYLDIYITYTVDKDSNRAIYLGEKVNIAQLTAYSTYEEAAGTTPKGLIDIDSNVGNINNNAVKLNETDKYEDNAFKVKLDIKQKTDERKISGFVFEDARSDKVTPFSQFTGNGIYNSSDARNSELISIYQNNGMTKDANQDLYNDKKLDGMTVELIEIVTVGDKTYEETIDPLDTTTLGNVVVRTQTVDGKYEITSFIPGTYIVRFRYGDIYKDNTITTNSLIHNGQDYKSTTYTLTDNSGNVLESTADNDVKYAKLTEANKSDARDNEYRRIEVMAESEVMTHNVAEFMKYTQYNVNNIDGVLNFTTEDATLREFSEATNCFADTVTFSLGVENKSDTKNNAGVEVTYRNFNEISLMMPNIDYGVVFRPENFIELTKKLKTVTINTSAGDTLVSLNYTEDGSLDPDKNQIGIDLVQAVDTLAGVQGFRYINIDEDLMQGATISIEYYLLADNVGEVDTVNQRLIDEGGSTAVKEKLQSSESVLYSTSATGSETYKNYSRMNDLIKQAYGSTDSYYYGRYLGGIYYNGTSYSNLKTNTGTSISTETVVTSVTINRIIDWIDNDATFVITNNYENNKFWTSTTETELLEGGLVGPQGLYVQDGIYYYKDEYNRKYTTDTRNNIAISSDQSSINSDLVKAIYPELYEAEDLETRGRITIEINAVLSADENEKNMTYDNVAELAKFTTVTGRRTNFASTIGNIKLTDTDRNKTPHDASTEEVDQAGTETVSLVPPTGSTLFKLMIAYYLKQMIIISCIIIAITVCIIIMIRNKKAKGKIVYVKKRIYK